MREVPVAQARVLEGRRVAVELLPIRFCDQRLHVLEKWRSRKRCKNLEKRKRRAQIDGIVDCCLDAFNGIGEKTDNKESFRRNAVVSAVGHNVLLMLRRNRTPADFL